MTTELPSGETFTEGKLTELKNSSRVSLGFVVWAWAKVEWVKTETEITDTSETSSIDRRIEDRRIENRRIEDGPIEFFRQQFSRTTRYTLRALLLANVFPSARDELDPQDFLIHVLYGAVGCALRSASSSVWLLGTVWSTTRHPSS